jgi:hypothetical protein
MGFRCRLTRQGCQDPRGAVRRTNGNRRRSTLTCLAIWAALSSAWSFSQSKSTSQPTPAPKAISSGSTTKTLTDTQMSRMSSDELANYVFQHHGCKNCHTLGKAGKLGLTEQGMEVGKNYEGCVSLLTSMNLIAQLKDADLTKEDGRPVSRVRLHHVSSNSRAGKNGAHQLRSKAQVAAYGLHGCRETHEPAAVTLTAILLSCASSLACF